MCYLAQIKAEWKQYMRAYGLRLSLEEFYDLFWRRARVDAKIRIPKVMEAMFDEPASDGERAIKGLIDEFRTAQEQKLQKDLFAQRKLLADAERALLTKTTKAATDSRRIAASKIETFRDKLARRRAAALDADDCRIFPQWYAPVIVIEGGQRLVKPMRYQCRPPGKPEFFERKYPGTYNARRDSLGGFDPVPVDVLEGCWSSRPGRPTT